MEITLTQQDFEKLSPNARKEIAQFIWRDTNEDCDQGQFKIVPYDLRPRKLNKFMEKRISDKTKSFLIFFAESKAGLRSLSEILNEPDYPTQRDLNGVLSGITRRLRSITGFDDVKLIDNYAEDGYEIYCVSNVTHQSLRKYFKIE
jgi:hypothetical protein